MAEARVTYVGHATVLLELGGVRLLTDPLLRSGVGPLRRQGPAPGPEISREIDAVLVSHLHHDHADLASLRRLGRDVRLLVPPGSRHFFERRRFAEVTELAPGETARVGEVEVTAVEARHEVGRRRFAPASEPIGFLLDGPRRVYFAGDTDLFEGMAAWGGDIDLALLPIWGWGPTLGAGHLDPERAARVAALLAPKLAVPIHWGTLYPFGLARFRRGPLLSPPREFVEWMRKLAPQTEPLVLAPGEATSLA
ncbi:MAG TPA: MBL fold metallo-hydrolase [Solirubrobacterales bacterium]|nr:MBL fold metallo-hydrolase [Solirubrobacterales bacterium]